MGNKKSEVYTFTLKKKELIAVIAGILVTYLMVFILGYTLGKESVPVSISTIAETYEQQEAESSEPTVPPETSPPIATTQQERPTSAPTTLPKANETFTPSPKIEKKEVAVEIPVKPIKHEEKKSFTRYFVQAGAFSKKKSAERLAERLKEKGYKITVMKVGGLYKVLIGPFVSKKEAIKNKGRLIKDEKIYGYIVHY